MEHGHAGVYIERVVTPAPSQETHVLLPAAATTPLLQNRRLLQAQPTTGAPSLLQCKQNTRPATSIYCPSSPPPKTSQASLALRFSSIHPPPHLVLLRCFGCLPLLLPSRFRNDQARRLRRRGRRGRGGAGAAAGAALHFVSPLRARGGGGGCRTAAAQAMDTGVVAAAGARATTGAWLDAAALRGDHDEWMVSVTRAAHYATSLSFFHEKHPSALAEFEAVVAAATGKQVVMFLDYDGTLSPIVKDPDTAVMTEEARAELGMLCSVAAFAAVPNCMRDAVRGVAEHFPTAIVSGRCRDKLYYAGSHGMDIKGPTAQSKHAKAKLDPRHRHVTRKRLPASEFLPVIDEVCRALTAKTAAIPGATVENNKFCLSVHFRCVPEEVRIITGRKVLEIRPSIKWDKGNALQFLLEALGIGILVSKIPKETSASYSLQEPSEVVRTRLSLQGRRQGGAGRGLPPMKLD
ncbi:hypothetical protein HU200_004962 [Digitaria exilis]|uniref:Trehalose 6-phosphate phosphatase n=1 Tax=Digitaria exilis TaxID=1010633 RepID=A0A835KWX4_9POAL|nr:hypothetical protein HU200_004962 [Digitaria exilis]